MTDREKVIVMAYTGVCMLHGEKLGLYYRYAEEKLGKKPIYSHDLYSEKVQEELKDAARPDFIALCKEEG